MFTLQRETRITRIVEHQRRPLRCGIVYTTFWWASLWVFLVIPFNAASCQIYDFKSYTVREGLLSNGVTCLCQDSFGYLWIGTTDGISVYDGRSFRNYTVIDGLSSSWINCIVEDRNQRGVMWIATLGGGVSSFDDGVFRNFKIGSNDWTERVNSISQDSDGTLFCATDQGVYSLKNGVATAIPKLSTHAFGQIACAGDTLLLLDDKGGLFSYDLKDGVVIKLMDRWTDRSETSAFALGHGHQLWLALTDGTVEDFSHHKALPKATGSPASFLVDDGHENLWVGGDDGLYEFNKRTFGESRPIHFTTANGLPDNRVYSGLRDTEGDLWLGIGAGGLCKLTDENTCAFKIAIPSLAIDNSQAASDSDGHIWAIDRKGIIEIWRKRSGKVEGHLHSFKELGASNPEYSIRITDGSILWVCCADGTFRGYRIVPEQSGPSRLELSGKFSIGRPFGPGEFLTFFVDREHRIFCSLNKFGIIVLDTKRKIGKDGIREIRDNLPDNSVRAIYEDSEGNFWFGGYLGGLAEFRRLFRKDSSIRLYTTNDGLPDNSIRAITQDSLGNLWIGTRFGGLAIFRKGKFEDHTEKEGLVSNGVWAIASGNNSGMLLATQLGLQSLKGDTDGHFIFRGLSRRTPVYSVGISSADLRWICTPKAITITDLSKKSFLKPAPVVRVTRFLVDGQALPFGAGANLAYNRNTVTFDFVGISLRDEKNLSYDYRLLGVDKEWLKTPQAHAVTYVSLKPGDYTFEVRAIDPSGLESKKAATVAFAIVPPYWDRWWFIVSAVLMVVGLIYSAFRFRVNRLLEIGKVRSRIAMDLHDEIGSGLTRIAMLADFASGLTAEASVDGKHTAGTDEIIRNARASSQRIGSSARNLIDSMSDVIWSIDPKYDSLADFLFYFRNYANELAEAKGIALDIQAKDIDRIKIGAQVKRTLQLISKEALNNSVKYSRCKSVKYRLTVSNKNVSVAIEDDGCGFDPKSVERGHGLNNMEKHAREMGGDLVIDSSPGKGTRLVFMFPLP
jgi:ligand-binding sensor domain-containing protein/signal transduction histidine kinase